MPYTAELLHLEDVEPNAGMAAKWHRVRNRRAHWVSQLIAEAFAAFVYCWAGGACAAGFTLGNLAELPIGSLFTTGLGYGIGVVLALSVCASTSGGHFSPAMTIVAMLFKGFPVKKGFGYIIAQIFGAYVAFGFVYLQWRPTILLIEEGLVKQKVFDVVMFQTTGPAGIFALYAPAGYPLGTVFLNEFVVDFVLGVVVFACTDPTNHLVPPAAGPWVVGMAFATAIWGFAVNGVAINTARDLGGRLFAITVWGKAANGGTYAAIAALTNIPATILASLFYQFVFADSQRVMNPEHKFFNDSIRAHTTRLQRIRDGSEIRSMEDAGSTEKV